MRRWKSNGGLLLFFVACWMPSLLCAQQPVEEGQMRYAGPEDQEFLLQIDLNSGETHFTPESAARLNHFRKTGTFFPSVVIELHPAPNEKYLGELGIARDIRIRKTSEALEEALHSNLPKHPFAAVEQTNAITIPEDPTFTASTAVSRVKLGWLAPTLMRILYVTDRNPSNDKPGHLTYGKTETGHLAYGWATARIDQHLTKPPSGPWAWVTRWTANDPIPASGERLSSFAMDDFKKFANVLTENLSRTGQDEVLVYVHGFKTTYDQVVGDATVLGYLTKFPGPVIAYSWASQGDVPDYDNDYEIATRTIPRLAQFLTALKGVNGVKRVHVVAHSMGARVLFWALKNSPDLRLNEVVFVAGDVARQDFQQYFAADVAKTAGRFTIYSTQSDIALFASSKVHKDARVGYAASPDGPFIMRGIDSVDATDVVTDVLSHGYQINSKLPQTDLLSVLHGDAIDIRGCVQWVDETKKDFLRYICR